MLQPRIAIPLRRTFLTTSSIWLPCQSRLVIPSIVRQSLARPFTSAHTLRQQPTERKPTNTAPAPDPKDEDIFIPKPLGRPIGFANPPQPGENTVIPKIKKDYSGMTMSQRNLEKRKDLVEKWSTNYFRDFKNIRKYRSGKTFLANQKIFKKGVALYFPNFHGNTLEEKDRDTTDVLNGKISVVNVYSSTWGLTQVESFTGKKTNATLHEILAQNPRIAQMVDINIEENSVKAWLIALFQWRLKASKPKEDWGRYFVVRRGVSEKIRETIGLLNGRVGYVYLVDQDCKIRWAGSGDAEGTEMDDMNRGFVKLVSEAQQSLPQATPGEV